MRSRSNSGVRLDYYQRLLYQTILNFQDPVTGLIPSEKYDQHAWVRDNVYCVLSVWGLSMAYKKNAELDEDRAKTYELEQSCVKLMRGLLMAMMKQKDKVERFKESQSPADSLHAKYSSVTGSTCVGDSEWGHLQIDATSLYLLVLAQMTASGLQIVFSLDEVAFVQNLVFYIENAYCIPDYGIWERGDKTNHGLPELNISSVGLAKAALEALNELDLFGGRGGPPSVIHVLPDEAQKCDAVLNSMLPRESNSKEVGAALLSIIGQHVRQLLRSFKATTACKRFLRDGFKTAKEDPRRLHYEPWELQAFEHIECEWPLFFCYMIIDACFRGDANMADEYSERLERVMVKTEEGLRLVPEMYGVPADKVHLEYQEPHSQIRVPVGQVPYMWAQSLFILGRLLQEGFLAPGELDPLNRRLCSLKRPDVVVQVVLLAEDSYIKEKLAAFCPDVETVSEVCPFEVQPARVLGELYSHLGQNRKLGLMGRPTKDVGLLATSKLYLLQDRLFVFSPQNLDSEEFHLVNDVDLFADTLCSDISVLRSHWNILGRPTMVVTLQQRQLLNEKVPLSLRQTIKKLSSGYLNGTRVSLGKLSDFISTSCIASLDFLRNYEDGNPESLPTQVRDYLDREMRRTWLNRPEGAVHAPLRMGIPGARSRKSITGRESFDFDFGTFTAFPTTAVPSSQPRRSSVEEEIPLRAMSELQLDHVAEWELLTTLRETDSLEEQGDILHYLSIHKGLNWDTGLGQPYSVITVKDLFQDFYERTCQEHKWGLVRHFANCLGKRVEDLAKSVTDLLVRQKQVTVGMPPHNEEVITRPLSTKELRVIIARAYRGDQSTAMLTQELLAYLAMFIRTDPHLFHEMLRLRVGLIIQVMAAELARASKCSAQDTAELLLGLSPFEMKSLLLNILSGRELAAVKSMSAVSPGSFAPNGALCRDPTGPVAASPPSRRRPEPRACRLLLLASGAFSSAAPGSGSAASALQQTLTKEMTPGELKFALRVEETLNKVPEPEYRQLLVEAFMVLSLIVEHEAAGQLQLTHRCRGDHQRLCRGNSTLCCLVNPPIVSCCRTAGICQHFLDSAPSGCFGTMTYLVRSVAYTLHDLPQSVLECQPS
ncbi:hypothetical protein HPB48_008717 [Haemaphysalis longicornis]|uniref:Phosphorylase b kinase regulatory subunit n=1 Tax=Haemaphysalis longicornis TaxID=44386 RepID=A0A9J6H2D7_HAELO|nr:hypothetical protein HPB48_008717 [Haemaphysalis longicornis]